MVGFAPLLAQCYYHNVKKKSKMTKKLSVIEIQTMFHCSDSKIFLQLKGTLQLITYTIPKSILASQMEIEDKEEMHNSVKFNF